MSVIEAKPEITLHRPTAAQERWEITAVLLFRVQPFISLLSHNSLAGGKEGTGL